MGRDQHKGVSKNAINYKSHRSKHRKTAQGRNPDQYRSSAQIAFWMLLIVAVLLIVSKIQL